LSTKVRIGYRDHVVWVWLLIWAIFLSAPWFVGDAPTWTWTLAIWLLGIALTEANAIRTALRSMRGLTLAADGIIWHKHEVFLPWSNVTELEQVYGKGGLRLVIRVDQPNQALEQVSKLGRWEVMSALKRFGGPITLKPDRLAVPAVEVMANVERLRQEYAASGGFAAFANDPDWPRRKRAARSANVWAVLGSAGLVLSVMGPFLSLTQNINAKVSGGLTCQYRSIAEPGFMDQVLSIGNSGGTAVAPTLTLVPLDRTGKAIPGLSVRTAFGSDHGMVVVPPTETRTTSLPSMVPVSGTWRESGSPCGPRPS
jgi:hypothetical protein